MQKVIFIHGYASKEMCEKLEELNVIGWYGWLQEKLKEKGYKVFNPLVKNLWEGNYDNWKKEFEKLDYDEDTIIVAHSAGVAFIVRFLGEINKKINKLILVAPAKIIGEDKTLEKFYDFEINNNLKNNIKKVKIFVSQDDEERHNKSALIYKEKLNGDLQIFKNKGHFILEKFEEILKEF